MSPIEVKAAEKATEKATAVNSMKLHILEVPTTRFTASEVNEKKKNSRDAQPVFKSGNRISSDVENEPESHSPAHQVRIYH
ncbi:uncharacterized protein N7446_013949 [Penicillium canescens]|uniref:Uncharacterized protein n=1 Tax=Penicillium canescens TaxID=5083 RepID=A0AAD6HZW7_PENCN|nr:uncharacterized protein N7446_013949 [Penicillium canescens]KAJ6023584.1 hypothetical protein N7460_013979 [Penicillium canescens]KAJ6025138.1 hypothetical protein N7444_012817 [Penicillium canescens]KAJ6042883.1 hypothetical protein N7446_013949 [Penicillium canescens]